MNFLCKHAVNVDYDEVSLSKLFFDTLFTWSTTNKNYNLVCILYLNFEAFLWQTFNLLTI